MLNTGDLVSGNYGYVKQYWQEGLPHEMFWLKSLDGN